MSLRSTGSWFPLPALVGVVVLFPLALLSHAATLASATAATRLSPFRALLLLQLLHLGTLLLILTHHWAMLRCFRLFSNFEISAIFRF